MLEFIGVEGCVVAGSYGGCTRQGGQPEGTLSWAVRWGSDGGGSPTWLRMGGDGVRAWVVLTALMVEAEEGSGSAMEEDLRVWWLTAEKVHGGGKGISWGWLGLNGDGMDVQVLPWGTRGVWLRCCGC